jgi:hypothetical protein
MEKLVSDAWHFSAAADKEEDEVPRSGEGYDMR